MSTPRTEAIHSSPGTSSATQIPLGERSSSSSSASARPPRRSRHQNQHNLNHHQQQQQRYNFNNLEAAMPVNIWGNWGMDRRDVWRTCFCFHVRTVTIFIGVCHLMLYILYLSFLAAMFMYDAGAGSEGGLGKSIRQDQMLPTPVSVSNNNVKQYNDPYDLPLPKSDSLTIDQSDNPRARLDPLNMVMDTRKANSQVVLLTACNMLITLLMVYGAVRGKPSYLMPFFVLRVFDFCIFCLTMVGYFSYLPNVTDSISHAHWIPNREFLLDMDPQLLSLLALVTIVMFIAVKAYIIGVVWNCYKYLMLRNSVIRTVIAYRHDDPTNLMGLQQNLLPDLPDYDTAVNDPRYAKKPPMDANATTSSASIVNNNAAVVTASTISVPPPPYSVAVAAEPLTYNFQVPTQEDQEHVTQQQEQEDATVSSSSATTTTTIQNSETLASTSTPSSSSSSSLASTVVIQPVENLTNGVQIIEVAPATTTEPVQQN